MKVAVLLRPECIEIQDKPVPQPGPGEVLIRVRAVGICGSDTHYFAGKRDHEPQTVYPFILGHEFAGEAAALGKGVTGIGVGARVACSPERPCGRCEWCLKNESNVCPNVRFAASGGVPGCLCEYYVVHESQVHCISDSVGFAQATLAEPLAIGLHVIENLVAPRGGETYAVIGAGPIGLCTVFAARLAGAGRILVSDLLPARLEAARKLGADETCLVSREDFVQFVQMRTARRGVDVAIEAAGEPDAMGQVVHLASIHGLVVIEGIPAGGQVTFNVDAARRRELRMVFGRRSVHKIGRALELITNGTFDARVMLTHEFPLAEAQKAFEYTRDYRDGVIKAIVKP